MRYLQSFFFAIGKPFVNHLILFILLLFLFNGYWSKSLLIGHEYGEDVYFFL